MSDKAQRLRELDSITRLRLRTVEDEATAVTAARQAGATWKEIAKVMRTDETSAEFWHRAQTL